MASDPLASSKKAGAPGSAGLAGTDPREPLLKLPAVPILLATLGAGIAAAVIAAWLSFEWLGGAGAAAGAATGAAGPAPTAPDPVRSSLLGSAVSVTVALAGILLLQPWRTRPAGTWALLWLAGTVGRLLAMPLVGLAVYSATPVRQEAFLLSLAGTYLACLAAEVAVSARGIAQALKAGDASGGGGSSATQR